VLATMPAARAGGKCEDGVGRAGMPAPSGPVGLRAGATTGWRIVCSKSRYLSNWN